MTGAWAAMNTEEKLTKSQQIFDRVILPELKRTWDKFPKPMNSSHEGYGVLLEEVDEMWDAIKTNRHDEAVAEAGQVAAMSIRYIVEMIR